MPNFVVGVELFGFDVDKGVRDRIRSSTVVVTRMLNCTSNLWDFARFQCVNTIQVLDSRVKSMPVSLQKKIACKCKNFRPHTTPPGVDLGIR